MKKLWKMGITMIPIVISALEKGAGSVGNRRTNKDHQNYSMVENGQNTEKCPGDMMRLIVTPVKDHQLTPVWKTSLKYINHNRIREGLDMTRKGNLKHETESLLTTVQYNVPWPNYINAKIDNM